MSPWKRELCRRVVVPASDDGHRSSVVLSTFDRPAIYSKAPLLGAHLEGSMGQNRLVRLFAQEGLGPSGFRLPRGDDGA
jgi:hypothetical protein